MEPKISIEISRTINLGNFENVKVTAGVEETLDPKTTYTNGYQRLWEIVQANLDTVTNQALEAYDKKKTASPVSERKSPNPTGSRFRVPTVPE